MEPPPIRVAAITDPQTLVAQQEQVEAFQQFGAYARQPRPPHEVWLEVFLVRSGYGVAKLATNAAYADAALELYQFKFPAVNADV